eukprot:c33731_g1_i1.p1 GENE.c33731_g1_i1~~c33731_g1_i1.p1  ORF type:complete len:238 (+),score=78.94 c33731_g1_i1:71-784(+)
MEKVPKISSLVGTVVQILVEVASQNHSRELFPDPELGSFQVYVSELMDWIFDKEECYVLALYYMMQLESSPNTPAITFSTLHRMFFVCLSIAVKFHEDGRTKNIELSKIGHLRLEELNQLEVRALIDLKFNCYVSQSQYDDFVQLLSFVSRDLDETLFPKDQGIRVTLRALFNRAEIQRNKLLKKKPRPSMNPFSFKGKIKGFVSAVVSRTSSNLLSITSLDDRKNSLPKRKKLIIK